jgi:hypothetical protein
LRTLALAFAALTLAGLWLAGTGDTAVRGEDRFVFQIDLSGAEEVPPVETVAWGFVRFFFNEDRSEADYTVDVKSLSNTLVAGADIHRGAKGANGPVVFHLADGGFIVTGGHLSLTPAELREMASGDWYASVKTYANPEGELRGQIVVPAGFLPNQATPTPTRTARPTAAAPTGSATPVPATTPQTGSGGPTIRPPNTGDAGLRRSAAASGDAIWLALAGSAAAAGLLRRSRARPRAGRRPRQA